MGYQKMYNPKWDHKCGKVDYDYDDDCGCMDYPMYDMDCCIPKYKCKTEKKCVKTFSATYKLYKICQYRLYKCCTRCGHEYDYEEYKACPRCRMGY